VSTEQADNTSDLNRRVGELEREVVDLKQRITVLEGDMPETATVSATRAAHMLGFKHRSAITKRINSGEIDAYRVGKYWRVDVDSLRRYLRNTHN